MLEHKIVTQIFINGKKHYDLTIDDRSHSADSHIHVTCKVNNNIIEINDSRIFDEIKAMEQKQMIEFAEFVATYSDKNKNAYKEMLHAKSKYDGAETTINLLEQ